MKKSDISQPHCCFDKYIDCVEDVEISEAFGQSQAELGNLDLEKFNQKRCNFDFRKPAPLI